MKHLEELLHNIDEVKVSADNLKDFIDKDPIEFIRKYNQTWSIYYYLKTKKTEK